MSAVTTQTPDEGNLNLQTRIQTKTPPPAEQKSINPYDLKHSDHLYFFFFFKFLML